MLVGSVYLKDVNKSYTLRGYDFGSNIALYLSCPLDQNRKYIDNGITVVEEDGVTTKYDANWRDLYLSIGAGHVTTDCYIEENSSGKKIKNELNSSVISRVCSAIRGMIMACNDTNRDDLLEAMSGEFIPSKSFKYNIEDYGSVLLNMRVLLKLDYEDEFMKISLDENGSYEEKVFQQTKTFHKFKLDTSYLVKSGIDDSDWGLSEGGIYTLFEIIERNPTKSYVWLKERKYHIVNELEDVEDVCKKIWNHDGIVAFDTETTGLNVNMLSRVGSGDVLVGMVFAIKPGEAWYFPVRHKKIKNICELGQLDYILEKYFKPILEKKPLVCHNGPFDWKVMYVHGICINLVHDTYALFKLTLWNDHRYMELGLKPLTKMFLDRDSFELSDFVKGKWGSDDVKFWDLDEESVKYYACPDTDNDLELLEYALKERLLEKYGAKKIYQIEVAFSLVIAYQEFYGHCVDISKLDALVHDIKESKEKEYNAMVEIAGHDFNPRSNKELPKVMFEELGMPVINTTDTGNPSTDKNTRKALMGYTDENGDMLYPFAAHLHEYLTAAQLESNFTKNIDKFATNDGIMFSEVEQYLETGRVSVKKPNYQSYSDVVKHYIAPRDGYYAMDADYSSIEYRILACMAGQTNLIERFNDPDMDYHTYQASRLFDVPYELVSKKMRQEAKGMNFGIPYGMGDPSLGAHLYGSRTKENTLKAKKKRKLYFQGQENIEDFFVKARAKGVEDLYSETFFGRRRFYDPRKTRRDSIERQAGNARIQGTAADVYKVGMVNLFNAIRKNGLMGKVLISAFVHDECFLEVHKSIDPAKMLKMLRKCMMLDIKGWCSLYIGAGYGENWYDAKKTEMPVQVQQYIVDTWGDTGLDFWDGDTSKLFHWEVRLINDYRRDRVIDYLKNEENWGKVLNPVENGLAHEVMEEVLDGRDVDGVVTKDFECKSDMIDNLYEFCKCFGCEELFEKANIKRPEVAKIKDEDDIDTSIEYQEEKLSLKDMVNMRTSKLGVYMEGSGLYFRYDAKDPVLLRLIKDVVSSKDGNIDVYAVRDGEIYSTGIKTSKVVYADLLKMYMSRRNMGR